MNEYVLTMNEVFVIYTKNNCVPDPRNSTEQVDDVRPIQVVFLCLSVIALIFNLFSLIVFWHQPKSSMMRVNLILLSISETLFHSFMLLNHICIKLLSVKYSPNETPTYWHLYITPRIAAVTMVVLHVFISARNWCNLIISISRTEAVLYPLKSRRLFRHTMIYFIYFAIMALAIVLSILRHLDFAMTICVHSQYFVQQITFFNYKTTGVISIIYFILQTGIPWLSVITSTGIMIIVLNKFSSDRLLSNPVSQRNQKVAIRTVLLLAIIFSFCELPNLIASLVFNLTFFLTYDFPNLRNLEISGNTLVILDSIFNFFVYAVSLPYFRRKLVNTFRCKVCTMSRSVSLIYENTWRSTLDRSGRLNYFTVNNKPDLKHMDYSKCQKNSINEILYEENFITQV